MTPQRAANTLTQILDARDGLDRFDRGPVDPEWLALNYSAQVFSSEPIVVVRGEALDGCVGALVFGETKPRRWGILYDARQILGAGISRSPMNSATTFCTEE